METYLYFRKFRPTTFLSTQGSATQTLNTITGLGGDDIDSITEVASLVVTPADAANSNIGSAYSHPGAGGNLTLSIANGAVKTTSNSVITLNNNSEDADSGYTLESGDTVLMTFQQGLETSFMYPASSLIGMEATATGQTTLRFKSLKGDGTDDVVAINHDNGKYQDIVNGINAIINGRNHGGIVTVIDGHGGETRLSKELTGLGIDGLIYTPESGY
tara:strand:+ start:813 stop:1463 length:651 start_codon:yes stop_codon:yes gene_type:complete